MRRILTCNEKIPVKPYLRIFLRGMFRSWVISVILVGKIKPFCISESTVDTRDRTAPGHEATWCAMAAIRDQPRDTEPQAPPSPRTGVPPHLPGDSPDQGGPPSPPPRCWLHPGPAGSRQAQPQGGHVGHVSHVGWASLGLQVPLSSPCSWCAPS